jgi:hypothetical protein
VLLCLSFSLSSAQEEEKLPDRDRLVRNADFWPFQPNKEVPGFFDLQGITDAYEAQDAPGSERDRDIRRKAGLLADTIFTADGKINFTHRYDTEGRTTETIEWFNFGKDPSVPLSIDQWEYHPETGQVAMHREILLPNDEWERDSSEQYYDPQGKLVRTKVAYFMRDTEPAFQSDVRDMFNAQGWLISRTWLETNEKGSWDTVQVWQAIYDEQGKRINEISISLDEYARGIEETVWLYNEQGQLLQKATVPADFLGIIPLVWNAEGNRVSHREFPRYFEKEGQWWEVKAGRSLEEDTRRAYRNGRLFTVHAASPMLEEPFLVERYEFDSLGQRLLAKYEHSPGSMAVIHAYAYDQNGHLSRWTRLEGLPWLQYIFYFAPSYDLASYLNPEDRTFGGYMPMTMEDRSYQNDDSGNTLRYQKVTYDGYNPPTSEEFKWFPDGRPLFYQKMKGKDLSELEGSAIYTYDTDDLLVQVKVTKNYGGPTNYETIHRRSYVKR